MLIYALVTTAGVGALLASGALVRYAFIRRHRSRLTSVAIGVYALAALAGSLKFCYDLVVHRHFWTDDSTAIAVLNFVGILMLNYFNLLLVLVGCGLLYVASKLGAASRSTRVGTVES